MKQSIAHQKPVTKVLAAAVTASLLLSACVSTPQSPPGSADVRAKLTRLENDPNLASHAPLEIKDAQAAVRLAEVPVPKDRALGAYRVYLADYKVEIAEAKATTRYVEDQRELLSEQRENARLLARTREADLARRNAEYARDDAADARNDAADARDAAAYARNEANQARDDADSALAAKERALAEADRQRALAADASAKARLDEAELQRQIALLQAEATDRGIVLTLGNVLFETGRADLKSTATDRLNKLVTFLNQYPDRDVEIEGHTDNVGSDVSNQALSQRRAESVKSYLLQQGIGSQRLSAEGMGEGQPIGDNNTETGRQENRRVEIIIENPPLVAGS